MKEGSTIINTTSVNAFKGNAKLLDYTATKGAILAFTRGLALQLIDRGIRVNGQFPSHSNPNCNCNLADLCSDNPHLWKKEWVYLHT
jgi:NAD(P)-dependent dehydrogenase (short-subunit alcohol dehydrogenase family)